MNAQTPPPLDFKPVGDESPTMAFKAAKAAVTVPVILILMNVVFNAAKQGSDGAQPRSVIMIQAGLIVLFTGAGLIASIYALVSVRRHGRRGLLGRGLAGLIFNGLVMALFVVGFVKGRENQLNNRAELARIDAANKALRDDMRKELEEKGAISSSKDQLDRLQEQYQEAGSKLTGVSKTLMLANAAYARALQVETMKYEQALNAMQAAEVLSPVGLTSADKFKEKRIAVENFMAANQNLKTYLADAEKHYASQLRANGVPEDKISQALRGFSSSVEKKQPLLKTIRECDEKLGQAILGSLSLLETHLGKWKVDDQTGQLILPDDDTIEKYNRYMEDIDKITEEQTQAQEKLLRM